MRHAAAKLRDSFANFSQNKTAGPHPARPAVRASDSFRTFHVCQERFRLHRPFKNEFNYDHVFRFVKPI
jgi:hypothetical protein